MQREQPQTRQVRAAHAELGRAGEEGEGGTTFHMV